MDYVDGAATQRANGKCSQPAAYNGKWPERATIDHMYNAALYSGGLRRWCCHPTFTSRPLGPSQCRTCSLLGGSSHGSTNHCVVPIFSPSVSERCVTMTYTSLDSSVLLSDVIPWLFQVLCHHCPPPQSLRCLGLFPKILTLGWQVLFFFGGGGSEPTSFPEWVMCLEQNIQGVWYHSLGKSDKKSGVDLQRGPTFQFKLVGGVGKGTAVQGGVWKISGAAFIVRLALCHSFHSLHCTTHWRYFAFVTETAIIFHKDMKHSSSSVHC